MPLTYTKAEARKLKIPRQSIHTIQMDREIYTLAKARHWLHKHDFKYDVYKLTKNYRRFEQTPSIIGAKYSSDKHDDGLIFVFQEY